MNLMKLLLELRWKNFNIDLENLKENSYLSIDKLKSQQYNEFKKIYTYAIENIDYYKNNINYSIDFSETTSIDEIISRFPIINKSIIKENKFQFYNDDIKFINMTTGGSTGEPFSYRLGNECYKYSRLLKYKGYSYAGYRLGDPLIIFGGGSLVKKNDFKSNITNYLKEILLNVKKISSYGISEQELYKIYKYINKKDGVFIYGYVSSIYFLSLFIEKNQLPIINPPKAIFTTSEVLLENQRNKIESVFHTSIYNDYGINDSGGSAHECECHCGMHIDTERSIIEVIDENGNSISEGTGKVIITSLKNYAMPFFRYDTGDYARITSKKCQCGRQTPRILEIVGRATEFLKFGSIYIGSPALTILMGKLDIDLYQIIQTSEKAVLFKILYTRGLNKNIKNKCIEHITISLNSYVTGINIDIQFFDNLDAMEIKNKHKIIINNVNNINNIGD